MDRIIRINNVQQLDLARGAAVRTYSEAEGLMKDYEG